MTWISTAERMPSNEQLVAFAYNYKGQLQTLTSTFYGWEVKDGKWIFGGEEVLYWMPLPELPQ